MPTEVAVALISLAGLIVTTIGGTMAIVLRKILTQTRQVNDAVNHRHEDHPRIFDMVMESQKAINEIVLNLERFKAQYDNDQDKHGEIHTRMESKLERCMCSMSENPKGGGCTH